MKVENKYQEVRKEKIIVSPFMEGLIESALDAEDWEEYSFHAEEAIRYTVRFEDNIEMGIIFEGMEGDDSLGSYRTDARCVLYDNGCEVVSDFPSDFLDGICVTCSLPYKDVLYETEVIRGMSIDEVRTICSDINPEEVKMGNGFCVYSMREGILLGVKYDAQKNGFLFSLFDGEKKRKDIPDLYIYEGDRFTKPNFACGGQAVDATLYREIRYWWNNMVDPLWEKNDGNARTFLWKHAFDQEEDHLPEEEVIRFV